MPIVTTCTEQGCDVLTIGPWCVEHDVEPRCASSLRRGRPFPADSAPASDGAETRATDADAAVDESTRLART